MPVSGFGAHIKSTQKKLIIQKKNTLEEYPLDSIKNLLVIGGHTISSSTIVSLVKNGAFISFFEPDGNPVGIIRPFGDQNDMEVCTWQKAVPRHRYAIILAQAAIKSRLFAIQRVQESQNTHLFYEGEQEFLHSSQDELQYLIKLDEIQEIAPVNLGYVLRDHGPEYFFRFWVQEKNHQASGRSYQCNAVFWVRDALW